MSFRKIAFHGKYKIGLLFLVLVLFAGWIYMMQAKNTEAKRREGETYIRQVVASELHKKPVELTDEDFRKVTKLYFTYINPFDISLIEKCTKLEILTLESYHPWAKPAPKPVVPKWKLLLAKFHIIDLENKDEFDLRSLAKLSHLQIVELIGPMISDIKPIEKLLNLKEIRLEHTKVSDLKPISNLVNLQKLSITKGEVKNLEPIKGLKNLKSFYLVVTVVTDIQPIKGLTNLELLDIRGTPVSDIDPIKELKNLKTLYLQLSDIITRKQINELKKALPNADIIATKDKIVVD
jgi:hypothetical protein